MPAPAPAPVMIADPCLLPHALRGLAAAHPEIHDRLVAHLGQCMKPDGTLQFTARDLGQRSGVPFHTVRAYLRTGRERGLLHLLGRCSESGQVRYCVYRATEPEPAEGAAR